ncbi:glycosyltransferase family 2 protein [Oscillospiraceae bacterium MB24-C1]|nr:glycosyltransferase family 2 protein [Oscillospiraceae bacterium MB24-C1]
MTASVILTIAVPTFNMAQWLDKNLATYCDERLFDRLEVICLNNASEDSSKQIIESYVSKYPRIFRLIDRDSRGYGSSINQALAAAQGQYFRIVDADDWVNTPALIELLEALENCDADVVLTDYQIVNMQNGQMTPVRAAQQGVAYDVATTSFAGPLKTLPSIHNTSYRTELLRSSAFYMQDKMFFVDEEYVILPYLHAKNVIYYDFDIYRYQVANPAQSTSPKNRAKYHEHRERVLLRLIPAYYAAKRDGAGQNVLDYCFERIKRGVGDHFTTLYMYVEDRSEGRRLAALWQVYLQTEASDYWLAVRKKAHCLAILNRLKVGLGQYEKFKRIGAKR